jgi:hypothetical protein
VAAAALLKAASGLADDAAGMFEPKIFSADKQPDEVRRAYIEVQLQRLMMQTKSGNCRAVIDRLDKLGSEDGGLTFTMYGFNNFMKPAHFQYYMGAVEAFCSEDKSARKRWSKVAKMNDALPSAEFVFPILAEWRLNSAEAKPRIASALEAVRQARDQTAPQSTLLLMYIEGILLRIAGQEQEAAKLLQEVVKTSQDVFLTYLAQVGLREMFGR